jgi:hypothetical protein
MEYTTQCCEEKEVGYMTKSWNSDRSICFEDNVQGEIVYGVSNRLNYYDGTPDSGGTYPALTPPGNSWPVMVDFGEDCDVSELKQIGTLTLLLGDLENDAGIKLTFKGNNGYENSNGVWTGLVSWTKQLSPEGEIIPGLESDWFELNVVNGEAEIEIDETDWIGDPTFYNGSFYQYFLISRFVLKK